MNKVTRILSFTFSNLRNLAFIYLDENLIETIETNSFYNLPEIQLISLKNNNIKALDDVSFYKLNTFFSLNLFGNRNLSRIYTNSLSNISFFYLSYESLVSLKSYPHSWLKIMTLDLENNDIKVINENVFKGDFRKIVLSQNLISNFEKNSFGYLPYLREISFRRNLIKSLDFSIAFNYVYPNVEILDFSYNKIQSIEKSFFSKFQTLASLDLSFNDLHSLQNTFFLNLNELKQLYLNNNQILTIEKETFDFLENLIHLDLSQNLIYDLSKSVFSKLKNLKNLKLNSNQIEKLMKENFCGLLSLASLDLSKNKILSLQGDLFVCLNEIKALKLSSNKLKFFLNESIETLEFLDLSFNNLTSFNFPSLSSLDLSHNVKLDHLNVSNNVRVLNLSNTNSKLIINLNISALFNLEELDLSLNNLSLIGRDYFSYSKNLLKINLRATHLKDFHFLNELSSELREIDLSENKNFGQELLILKQFINIDTIKISNTNSRTFEFNFTNLKHLDIAENRLKTLSNLLPPSLHYLNISFNDLQFMFNTEFEFKFFSDFFLNLKSIDLSNSISKSISNKIFYFNRLLEFGYFSENSMNSLPKFCQIKNWIYEEIECKLKELKFNSNSLKTIFYADLLEMTNLEYLNLENNSIYTIELHSFSDLIKLETLILSLNNLTYFNDTFIFSPLSSLKFLNLSSNQIEIIQSNLFDSLFKLETLDLSWNRIRFIHSFAFNDLLSLRNLHLEENDQNLIIESNTSFSRLDSIQNIFLSKSVLNDENVKIFLSLFLQKTKSQTNKNVLGISFYRSLFLSSKYIKYDCNLTLFFISRNVHFNFRTETEIFDYFNECSLLTIKKMTLLDNNLGKSSRNYLIFTDFGVYFFWSYLMCLAFLAIYMLIYNKKVITN